MKEIDGHFASKLLNVL